MKLNTDFYRLSYVWHNPMGGNVDYTYDAKTQGEIEEEVAKIKQLKTADNYDHFKMSHVSWEMGID